MGNDLNTKKIIFAEGLEILENNGIKCNIYNLETLVLPNSLKEIRQSSYYSYKLFSAPNLKSIEFPNGNPKFYVKDNILYSNDALIYGYDSLPLGNIQPSNTIKVINAGSLSNSIFNTINLEHITTILLGAFSNSTFNELDFKNITKISSGIFSNSKGKKVSFIGTALENLIESGIFSSSNIEEVYLSDKFTIIPERCFENFKGKIYNLKNIKEVYAYGFRRVDLSYKECDINIQNIEVFKMNCFNYVTFKEEHRDILINKIKDSGDSRDNLNIYSFSNSNIKSLDLSKLNNIDYLADAFAYGCKGLVYVKFPSNLKTTINQTFSECSNLSALYFYTITPPSFTSSSLYNVGNNTKDLGINTIYTPKDSTGYEETNWVKELVSKANFVISKTL